MGHARTLLAEDLSSIRKFQDLSLDQLARRSGVSKSMLRGRPFGAEVADSTAAGPVQPGKKGYRLFPLVVFQPDRPVEMYYAEIDGGVDFDGEPHRYHNPGRTTARLIMSIDYAV